MTDILYNGQKLNANKEKIRYFTLSDNFYQGNFSTAIEHVPNLTLFAAEHGDTASIQFLNQL
jgi:hypothetical protein